VPFAESPRETVRKAVGARSVASIHRLCLGLGGGLPLFTNCREEFFWETASTAGSNLAHNLSPW
jgi:hypothetical protein